MTEEESEQRLMAVLESIAKSLDVIARTYQADLLLRYPPKKKAAEATVSRLKTDEEKLREDQGATGEEKIEDWATLGDEPTTGPREAAWIEKNKGR